MSLRYERMSLFDAPEGSVLVHACNGKGSWGSGIAAEFKRRMPLAFVKYNEYCKEFGWVGTAPIFFDEEDKRYVGCLITSAGYAKDLSPKDVVLVNTTLSLNALCANEHWAHYSKRVIYSNKFNSGLFRVPWEETERILKVFVDRYHLDWVICDPDRCGAV